jgi:hypothetical protein
MKKLSFLLVLFLTLGFALTVMAQRIPSLIIVSLDKDVDSIAVPSQATLIPGDTLQFVAVDGEFDIQIEAAYQFLKIREDNLQIKLSSSGNSKSEMYIVRNVSGIEIKYGLYCITCSSWPEAPPKIIVQSNANPQ